VHFVVFCEGRTEERTMRGGSRFVGDEEKICTQARKSFHADAEEHEPNAGPDPG